ncbi:MAG TPA: glycosyltransferase [Blastocatellia bacterium]|nr:glycosyltransferase [Blastocatellia bacterium]
MKLTIWMNQPSPYQDDLFTDLAASEEVDLQVVFAGDMAVDRLNLGWRKGAMPYRHHMLDARAGILEALRLAWAQRDRLHVVCGIWAYPEFAAALSMLKLSRADYVIYSESPDESDRRSFGRRFLRRLFGQWIAAGAAGGLAISHFAAEFFTGLGFNPDTVHRFGYFQSGRSAPAVTSCAGRSRAEIIYVGQFIRRKGVDVLLDALARLRGRNVDWHLTLVGDGPERTTLEAQAAAAGISDRLTFAGVIPSDQVRARIAGADLLALPSRWDGWGVVVNEAFSVGVPVLVSDRCGASDLVRHGVNGYIFRSENADELRGCLEDFMRQPPGRESMRAAARETGSRIATETVAPYLIECLHHVAGLRQMRPVPPWL